MDDLKGYKLSMYQDYGQLDMKEHIRLVRDRTSGQICVKKTIDYTQRAVIEFRKNNKSSYFPELYEVIEEDDKCIIIEEYINGITLDEYMMGNPLPQKDAIKFGCQICKALLELHQATPMIVYRDLKPENVVITKEGNVKIIDFNISRTFHEGKKRDTVLLGTAEYAAPEQFGYFQTDNRTDIYAFGVLFNYMLTAKFPVECISEGKYNTLIKKCIELEPSNRYQTIEEILNEFTRDDIENIHEEISKSWTIPGFRSKVIWKMILAILGYVFIISLCLDMNFTDSNGELYKGFALWINRIIILVAFLGSIFFSCDYRGISDGVTFYKHKSVLVRILAYTITWFVFVFVAVMISGVIDNILNI